jgi:hypothetical protein
MHKTSVEKVKHIKAKIDRGGIMIHDMQDLRSRNTLYTFESLIPKNLLFH